MHVNKSTHLDLESWDTPQRILVILAHPDDPEFFCGATLASLDTRRARSDVLAVDLRR